MKISLKIGLVLSVPMAASLAFAQQAGLPAVEVTAEEAEVSDVVLTISCSDPVPPELSDVSRLLKIHRRQQGAGPAQQTDGRRRRGLRGR